MAWRIHEAVVRGEIDNRVRGRITGRLWLAGHTGPVELEFAGNAWRDLAGHRLEFVNPRLVPAKLAGFGERQRGVMATPRPPAKYAFCAQEKLVEAPWLTLVERDLNTLCHACDMLVGEFRAKLEREK